MLSSWVRAIAFALLVVTGRASAGTVVVDDGFAERGIGSKLDVALDEGGQLSADDVRAGRLEVEASANATPSRGVVPGTFWASVTIEDRRTVPEALVLEQGYAQSDMVRLHEEGRATQVSGDHVRVSDWPVRAREPAFVIRPSREHRLLIELRGDMTKQLVLTLRSETAYRDHVASDSLAQGLYFGAIASLVLYNLCLFVATRIRVYGLYAATVGLFLMSQLAIHGVGNRLFWGEFIGLNDTLATGFAVLFVIAGTPFFREILDLPRRYPRVARAMGISVYGFLAVLVSVPFLPNHLVVKVAAGLALVWGPTLLAVALRLAARGDRVALIVSAAWVALFCGMILYALRVVGLMPTNALTVYATQVGSVLEAILLSFALADRLKRLQREVVVKGELALANANEALFHAEAARFASDEALAARELAMRELDERRRLQGELDQATQQLTQAENMATLGMLMAGIAHDLRNPLNYVQGATEQLREAIPMLRGGDEAAREKTLGRVEKVVGWVEQGTASMDAISLAMRNQARGGVSDMEAVNVREVVNEALLLCRSRTKLCELEVDVQDTSIVADPTGLGQLVMNLVSNAADALAEAKAKGHCDDPRIRVHAAVTDGEVCFEVHDSGPGIPEALRTKILEPFFTTKPRGQGTGLGLAIVQRVVRQHEATLSVGRSDGLGGALFRIVIPQRLG